MRAPAAEYLPGYRSFLATASQTRAPIQRNGMFSLPDLVALHCVPFEPSDLVRYLGFDHWDWEFAAVGSITAKIITRPSIPRTSCGGNSSNMNESTERSRTASVT